MRAAQAEVIQTETGAREGVLTTRQIDNLSIIGRSSLELLRILPGVVAPDQNQLESVSFFGGSNNTQALHASTASAPRATPSAWMARTWSRPRATAG